APCHLPRNTEPHTPRPPASHAKNSVRNPNSPTRRHPNFRRLSDTPATRYEHRDNVVSAAAMFRRLFTLGLALALTAAVPLLQPSLAAAVTNPAGLVNTLIGTANHAETWPGADTPFGMVQWSPETTRGNQTRTPEPGDTGSTRPES